jgi:ABC-type multidrug transport system permease subunit
LGISLGVVVLMLAWLLGIMPPDRLALFGALGLSILLVAPLLTQSVARAKGTFVAVMVIGALLLGFGLSGLGEYAAGGSISDGCYLEGTSSLDHKTAPDTSVSDPFDAARDETIAWNAASDVVLTNWNSEVGLRVGGFTLVVWRGEHPNTDQEQAWWGWQDVASLIEDVEAQTGIKLSGIFHVSGSVDADEGSCAMTGYTRVLPQSAFSGSLLMTMWILLVVIVITVLTLAVSLRRSIKGAEVAPGTVGGPVSITPTAAELGPDDALTTAEHDELEPPTKE